MYKRIIISFILITLFLYPLGYIDANIITEFLASGLIDILKGIANGILHFSFSALEAVISEDFVGVKFTDNELVNEGWSIMRDFGNIIIILALIIIALATILDIKEYQAQKTIPILIIVALLVNFSPVICGLFIDASNIIMLNFLKAGFPGQMKTDVLEKGLDVVPETEDIEGDESVGEALLFLFFSIIASFVVLIYAVIFIFRYIALWLLVIFSPLAFVFYILKFTRKYFHQWLNQFFQWSFIGVSVSIILYLTVKMMSVSKDIILQTNFEGNFYKLMAGGLAPVIFLVAGLFASFQTGAMGASAITSWATQRARSAGRWTWRATGGAALDQAERARQAAGRGIKSGAKYLAREGGTTVAAGIGSRSLKKAFDTETREKTKQGWDRWLERGLKVKPVGYAEEQSRKRLDLENTAKRMESLSGDRLNETAFAKRGHIRNRLAALKELAKRGKLGGGKNEAKFKDLMKEMRDKDAFKAWGFDTSEIYKHRPELHEKENEIRKEVKGTPPGKLREQYQAESFKDLIVLGSMTAAQAKEVLTKGSTDKRINLLETGRAYTNTFETRRREFEQEALKAEAEGKFEIKTKNNLEAKRVKELQDTIERALNYNQGKNNKKIIVP